MRQWGEYPSCREVIVINSVSLCWPSVPGMVHADTVLRVSGICRLIQTILATDPDWAWDNIPQLSAATKLLVQVLHRSVFRTA